MTTTTEKRTLRKWFQHDSMAIDVAGVVEDMFKHCGEQDFELPFITILISRNTGILQVHEWETLTEGMVLLWKRGDDADNEFDLIILAANRRRLHVFIGMTEVKIIELI